MGKVEGLARGSELASNDPVVAHTHCSRIIGQVRHCMFVSTIYPQDQEEGLCSPVFESRKWMLQEFSEQRQQSHM